MKKVMEKSMKNIVLLTVFLVAIVLTGCSGKGRIVAEDKWISLQEQGAIDFRQGLLWVTGEYLVEQSQLTVKGTTGLDFGYDSLNVRLLFLDSTGHVLEQTIVYSSGFRVDRHSRGQRAFDVKLEIPQAAVSFSFSYSSQERSSHR